MLYPPDLNQGWRRGNNTPLCHVGLPASDHDPSLRQAEVLPHSQEIAIQFPLAPALVNSMRSPVLHVLAVTVWLKQPLAERVAELMALEGSILDRGLAL